MIKKIPVLGEGDVNHARVTAIDPGRIRSLVKVALSTCWAAVVAYPLSTAWRLSTHLQLGLAHSQHLSGLLLSMLSLFITLRMSVIRHNLVLSQDDGGLLLCI